MPAIIVGRIGQMTVVEIARLKAADTDVPGSTRHARTSDAAMIANFTGDAHT